MNNGVYKSGFCTSQQAYERAQAELYTTLDDLDARLSRHRFLLGDKCVLCTPAVRVQLCAHATVMQALPSLAVLVSPLYQPCHVHAGHLEHALNPVSNCWPLHWT